MPLSLTGDLLLQKNNKFDFINNYFTLFRETIFIKIDLYGKD